MLSNVFEMVKCLQLRLVHIYDLCVPIHFEDVTCKTTCCGCQRDLTITEEQECMDIFLETFSYVWQVPESDSSLWNIIYLIEGICGAWRYCCYSTYQAKVLKILNSIEIQQHNCHINGISIQKREHYYLTMMYHRSQHPRPTPYLCLAQGL